LRITIVNGENILAEYDLLARCWYTHEGQKFPHDWQQTLRQFRKTTGIELTKPQYSSEREIFVISDLHLGHGNIIKYCSRPFPHDAVDEMDQMLIRNWNYTVKPDDRIYHIGDLCYGPLARNLYEYLQRLNGQVTLIQGNHDERERAPVHSEPMVHKDIPFLLVHDPDDAPVPFEGWVIHGHHHNNDLENYPFINFEKRRINVSAELVRYQPVPLAELCNIIKDHQIRPYVKSMLLREAEQEQKPYTTYLQRKHSSPDTG
jgi:calcineurin-like phosphoesterase family protein